MKKKKKKPWKMKKPRTKNDLTTKNRGRTLGLNGETLGLNAGFERRRTLRGRRSKTQVPWV